eukprot:9694872-Ditylum_brightwellii.AAC.1
MTIWTERNPSRVTRDVTVWASVTRSIIKANIMGENTRRKFVITMVFVTMTLTSATLFKLAESTFSPCTVLRNSKGSDRSGVLKMLKGMQKDTA